MERAVAATSAWPRLLVPEELGGAGATAREAAVVLEEIGRAVAPVPFLTSAVVATTALSPGGDDAGDAAGRLAAGEATAALLVPFAARATSSGHGPRRRGRHAAGSVTHAWPGRCAADVLLVPVATDGGVALHGVPAERRRRRRVEPVGRRST